MAVRVTEVLVQALGTVHQSCFPVSQGGGLAPGIGAFKQTTNRLGGHKP